MIKTALSRLRLAGNLEGISYLLLLGVAMPLKYFAELPQAVKISGWIHGVLFIAFIFCLADVKLSRNWPIRKTISAFILSLIPFGTFFLDKPLKAEEAAMKTSVG